MTSSGLYECLREVRLEKFYAKFTSHGVSDVEALLSLTLQDYPRVGVISMDDRERLFRCIQNIKNLEEAKADRTVKNRAADRGSYGSAAGQETGRIVTGQRGSSLKRPREAAGNVSPAIEKSKSKTQVLEIKRKSVKTPTPIRNKLKEDVITTGRHYNYGVPSNKVKISSSKRVSGISSTGSKIRVCVRKRPQSQAEVASGEVDVVEVTARDTVTVTAPKIAVDLTKYTQKHQFLFDEAFDENCDNQEVYERTAKPLIQTVFNSGKATCFAYGCTGSGKTFTMLGNELVQGIYIMAASDIFSLLHSGVHGQGLGMWVSFYEIYCGQLFDLLNARSRLFAREDGHQQVCIAGLMEQRVTNVEELMEVIEYGGNVRSTGSTGVNADSSRSHAILQLQLKAENSEEKLGRFSFIDLAGSERAADVTDTDKQTRLEGAEINQSLLALKECIRALDMDSRHTPFRQSKLTQVLKDSFIGNSQTCMIANISPGMSCSENTLNTLRYADRVKELKKATTEDIHLPRPATVHGTDSQLWPLMSASAATNKKLLPRVVIEPLTSGQNSEHLNRSLKKLKMSDLTSTGGVRPRTSSTEPTTKWKPNLAISTRLPLTRSINSTDKAGRNGKHRLSEISSTAPRPKTSPSVAVVQVKPVDIGDMDQVAARTDKYSLGLKAVASVEAQPKVSQKKTKYTKPTRNTGNVKFTQVDCADKKTMAVTSLENPIPSEEKPSVRNVQSCGVISRKCAGVEDTKRKTNAGRFSENCSSLDDKSLLRNIQSCEDVSTKRTKTEYPKKTFNAGKLSLDDKYLRNVQSCEDVSAKHDRVRSDKKSVTAGKEITSDAKPLRNIQSFGDVSESRSRGDWDETSASINTRYSTRLKTKIAKIFGGKNVGTTRDEQPDLGYSNQSENSVSATASYIPRDTRLRTRQYIAPRESQNMNESSLTEEQVVAAHHTQLALVTGLCQEEMVLLRQIDAQKQDFVDYIAELDDILTRKMSSIESLRRKIARYPFK